MRHIELIRNALNRGRRMFMETTVTFCENILLRHAFDAPYMILFPNDYKLIRRFYAINLHRSFVSPIEQREG